ncbi:hypothetical protein PIB30_057444, partial [Stylosanthes scabra]|nr:hypothetical protein [Stylosanthes scabra]
MEDHKAMQFESEELAALLSGQVRSRNWGLLSDILKLLQEHLNSPVAPRTSFELGNIDAESMLLQLRDLTRRHFEPSQRRTVEPNANTSPKEGQLSDSIVSGGSSGLQLNTSQGAVKGKQVCDLQVGISAGNEANNKEFDKVTPYWEFGIPKVWNGLTLRNKRTQPLLEGDKGDRFRADPNAPVDWSPMGGVLMDAATRKPPKHPRVSTLQMRTLGGTWPFNLTRMPITSPFQPLVFRDPIPAAGLAAPYPPLLISD